MRSTLRAVVVTALAAMSTLVLTLPASAGAPPRWAYAVVRHPQDTDGYVLGGKDRGTSTGGQITAENTEPGSVTVTFGGHHTIGSSVLVTPLSSKPRACAVGTWSLDGSDTIVTIECSDRHGTPTDTSFVVSLRSLRAGHGHVAYLWADNPGIAGYIPDTDRQMNGTDPLALVSVARVATGLWDVTLPDLAAPGGHVQVSPYGGTPSRCGVVSWAQSGDDEKVRVRCRALDGDPDDVRWTLLYQRGQGLGGPDVGPAAYLYANRKKAASYAPTFRYTSEGGASTVTRESKGRYRVTLPNLPLGGAAHVTPVGGGKARCNVAAIRRRSLPQRISVRCFDAAGQPADSRFTLSYVR